MWTIPHSAADSLSLLGGASHHVTALSSLIIYNCIIKKSYSQSIPKYVLCFLSKLLLRTLVYDDSLIQNCMNVIMHVLEWH